MDVNNVIMANIPTQTPVQTPSHPKNGVIPPDSESGQQKTIAVTNEKSEDNSSLTNSGKQKEEGMPKLDKKLTNDFLKKTIDEVNKKLQNTDRRFSYSVHEETGQYLVKIIDANTDEIIREIPPEKSLDAVAKMWEMAGIFVDEKK